MSWPRDWPLEAVLFDLDGTLIDTALDMVAVLFEMRAERTDEPLDFETARSQVSNGAKGLVNLAFPDAGEDETERLYHDYLDRYEQSVCTHSALFPGMGELLDTLENAGCSWGIVTNKPSRMTEPLLDALELRDRAGCAISGDTLAERKPHPAPLLFGCLELGVDPASAVYVGDASRDIEAGRAAGMLTIAAAYGYIPDGDDPARWNADLLAADTTELAHFLAKGVTLVP